MAGLNILGEFIFGIDVRILLGVGFVLLVLLAILWDAVAVPVLWVLDWIRGDDHPDAEEPVRKRADPNSRRTAESRERHAARIAARRAALQAKRTAQDPGLDE